MYKRILVPLDGTHRGEAILGHVEELARTFKAAVILTQVLEPVPMRSDHMEAVQVEIDQAQEREAEIRQYLRGKVGELREKGIEADSYVMHGGIIDAIIKLAEMEKADLIALTSHGRSGLGHLLHGSVATALLHRTEVPLLVIRAREN